MPALLRKGGPLPYLLEFLDLKDEYGESELEEALVLPLEPFLLELGAGFTFVARHKGIRIENVWYRMDLLLFHRRLRSLVIIDLKVGRFTHADTGQIKSVFELRPGTSGRAGRERPRGDNSLRREARHGGPLRDRLDQREGLRVGIFDEPARARTAPPRDRAIAVENLRPGLREKGVA